MGALIPAACRAQDSRPDELVAVGEGVAALGDDPAAAEEEAIWDAKRAAVEQAAGVMIHARTVGRNDAIESDEIRANVDGFVRSWSVVPGSRWVDHTLQGDVLRLKVRAVVALLPVVRRLADIRDVYDDLERPRVAVRLVGPAQASAGTDTLVVALRSEHFAVARDNQAAVVLVVEAHADPTVAKGDADSPYGIGEAVAACRARLTVKAVSTASEEVLFTAQTDGSGASFDGDEQAARAAFANAAGKLAAGGDVPFLQQLLVRWVHERQEGHVVSVQVAGLPAAERARVRDALRGMRGFRRLLAETADAHRTVYRVLTTLDTRALRRRLADLRTARGPIRVLNDRGPIVQCAAVTLPRISRN